MNSYIFKQTLRSIVIHCIAPILNVVAKDYPKNIFFVSILADVLLLKFIIIQDWYDIITWYQTRFNKIVHFSLNVTRIRSTLFNWRKFYESEYENIQVGPGPADTCGYVMLMFKADDFITYTR